MPVGPSRTIPGKAHWYFDGGTYGVGMPPLTLRVSPIT
jgi:hypothetical protein